MKLVMLLISFIGGALAQYGPPPTPPPPPCNTPQCSGGSYCFTNTNQCTNCPSGYRYNSNPNVGVSSTSLWGCTICPSGSFSSSSGSASCSACSSGTFSASAGSTSCTACSGGTFAANSGQSSCSGCSSCSSGKFVASACTSSADIVCTSCTPIANCLSIPTCSSASNSQCANCNSGYYLSSPSSCAACLVCSNGVAYETGPCTSSSNRQCTTCTNTCPVGQMLAGNCLRTVNKFCITCPTNFYKSLSDGSPCLSCITSCVAGYQINNICSASSNSVCLPCAAGYYKSLNDGSACLPCLSSCPVGFQLNQACTAAVNPLCITCPSGFYKSLSDGSPCLPCLASCQAGFQLNQACTAAVNPICIACPSGFYKSLSDGSLCLPCLANCAPGFEFDLPCSSIRTPICIACPSGSYKSLGDDSTCQPCLNDCGPGAYLTFGCNATNNPSCLLCPPNTANPNHFSVFQTPSCVTCANGAISVAGSATCLQCAIGKATFGLNNCTNCQTGSYADTLGSIACKLCPAGTANNQIGMTAVNQCIKCLPGYYSDSGATVCTACPLGTYDDGNNECMPCLDGTYNNLLAQTTCALCPAGTANMNINQVSINACIKCLPGSFSIAGSSQCTLCTAGTFTAISGTPNNCTLNPPGTYTPLPGSIIVTQCAPGSYSESIGTINCTTCNPGFYNNKTGSFNKSDCLPCPPGTYAPASGAFDCIVAFVGFYQDTPGQSISIACPAGTANNLLGSANYNTCIACLPGKYQPQIGSSLCIACPSGSYQNNAKQTACILCPAGTYSSLVGANNIQLCLLCPAGTYSAVVGANTSLVCNFTPLGTYSNINGSTNYTICPTGTYQNNSKQTGCLLCPAGTYNSLVGSINSSFCLQTPPGFYTPLPGFSTSQPCLAGSWLNASGKTVCQLCAPGTFTEKNASISCLPCPSGTFALGSGFANCEPIGVTTNQFVNISAHETTVVIQTNFLASFPFDYSCSNICQIYINEQLIIAHTAGTAGAKHILLPLILGLDKIVVIYNDDFNSSLARNAFTCSFQNNSNSCYTIPSNNVVQAAVLITTRNNLVLNLYADPAITFFSSIITVSPAQTYTFTLLNLEAAVAYSVQVIFEIIDQTYIFESIRLGSFTTKPAVPTGAAQNLVKYFIGLDVVAHANNEQSNLQVHWDPPEIVHQHGEIIGYQVDYRQEERSFISYGPEVNHTLVPEKGFSLFHNDTTIILSQLTPDTNYNITIYPMTAAPGLGPGTSIQLKTRVSAPLNPPVLSLISRTRTNITVSWTSLTNETGIITKVWIVAEPYKGNQTSSVVVHVPVNNSAFPELPFPAQGIRGFFGAYNFSNPCQEHIIGYTFRSIFSGAVCGGICPTPCELGTPMFDPTVFLPTNDQNLTNNNYILEINNTDGNITLLYVPYLTMKRRFAINSTQGGLLGGGKFVIGDGKINPNSLLNNTFIDPTLSYRLRFIVFTSETLYAISDPLDIGPFQEPDGVNAAIAAYIGLGLFAAASIAALCIWLSLRAILKKVVINDAKKAIKDEERLMAALLAKNRETTSIYFDVKAEEDGPPPIYAKLPLPPHLYAKPMPYMSDPYRVPNVLTKTEPAYDLYNKPTTEVNAEANYLDVTNDNWLNEEVFAVPSQVLYTETSEELFAVPAEIITKKNVSVSNPNYFAPNN